MLPSVAGEMSDLYITDLISAEEADSHHHVFYPGDCFVLWFDLIDTLPDWVPVPNEIDTCEFEDGEITCERLSDTAIKLNIGTHVASVDGHVGKIQNIPTSDTDGQSTMTINRIDFYDECGIDATNLDTIVANDTTPLDTVFTIEISEGDLQEGSTDVTYD